MRLIRQKYSNSINEFGYIEELTILQISVPEVSVVISGLIAMFNHPLFGSLVAISQDIVRNVCNGPEDVFKLTANQVVIILCQLEIA